MIQLIVCTIACAITLILEHVALWDRPWRLHVPAAYSVGVGTLAFWYGVWTVLMAIPLAGLAFVLLACCSGVWVIVAYWWREQLDVIKQNSRDAGRAEAQPLLTQDIIDRGGWCGENRQEHED